MLIVVKGSELVGATIYKVELEKTNLRAEIDTLMIADEEGKKYSPMKLLLKSLNRIANRRKLSHNFWHKPNNTMMKRGL